MSDAGVLSIKTVSFCVNAFILNHYPTAKLLLRIYVGGNVSMPSYLGIG